tara:strand:- start:387 stop:776 length:390 start_codon:yes stop_codon:yes gene_type:complete
LAKLTFKNDKKDTLARMLRHAIKNKRKIPYVDEYTDDYGLTLVKDEGIYLMSSAERTFKDDGDDFNTVVYARGYKPTKANRDTLWDKTYAVSGDDFAEFIKLGEDMVYRVLHGGSIVIELEETTLTVTA